MRTVEARTVHCARLALADATGKGPRQAPAVRRARAVLAPRARRRVLRGAEGQRQAPEQPRRRVGESVSAEDFFFPFPTRSYKTHVKVAVLAGERRSVLDPDHDQSAASGRATL